MRKFKVYNIIIAVLAALATLFFFLPSVVIVAGSYRINISFSALSAFLPTLLIMLFATIAIIIIASLVKSNKGVYIASIALSCVYFLHLFNVSYIGVGLPSMLGSSLLGVNFDVGTVIRPTFWLIVTYIIMILIILISIVALIAVKLEKEGHEINAETFMNYTTNTAKEMLNKVSESTNSWSHSIENHQGASAPETVDTLEDEAPETVDTLKEEAAETVDTLEEE